MRFIDSNVFLHAFLKPRRELTEAEERVKEASKAIVKRIEEGEEVAMTAVHISEVVNIVESGLGLQRSLGFLAWTIAMDNIHIYPTTIEDYEASLTIAKESSVSANDAIAYLAMMDHQLNEIYSFDKHFDQFKDIQRIGSQ